MKKRVFALVLAAVLALGCGVPVRAAEIEGFGLEVSDEYDWERFKGQNLTLNVYNWGQYISDGSDESVDVIKAFEQLTGIRVAYLNYETNETLYAKMSSGGADFDVIIPSDYMIGKMVREGMLAKLDYGNIPNAAGVGAQYRAQSYDPADEYSVPYMWGVVGLVYNTTMVDGEVDSWDVMWDPAYAGNVLMFNNSRDAFAIAARKLGMSMNPKTTDEVERIAEELKSQKAMVQAYVMDEIFDKMGGGEAAIAPYYAGDAITMIADNPDLAFAIPVEGTNYFVDAMCVPASSKKKEAAEMFINFMCEADVGAANCDFIGYSTPITAVWEQLDDELKYSPIAYPAPEVLANTETFEVLEDDINRAMDEAWGLMKSYDAEGSGWVILLFMAGAVGLNIFLLVRKYSRKKRDNY